MCQEPPPPRTFNYGGGTSSRLEDDAGKSCSGLDGPRDTPRVARGYQVRQLPAGVPTHRPVTCRWCQSPSSTVAVRGASGAISVGESQRGFYVGIEYGLATAAIVESSVFHVSHRTKCDVLLYSDPSMAPTGAAECSDDTPRMCSNSFDPGTGFAGGLSAG